MTENQPASWGVALKFLGTLLRQVTASRERIKGRKTWYSLWVNLFDCGKKKLRSLKRLEASLKWEVSRRSFRLDPPLPRN